VKPMSTAATEPAAMTFPQVRSCCSTMQPAEALAFLSLLIAVSGVDRQHAVWEVVVRESFPLELKLHRWRRALTDIAVPYCSGPFHMWDRIEGVLEEIDELNRNIRFVRRSMISSGVAHFLLQLHRLAAHEAYSSSFQGSVETLARTHVFPGLSMTCANRLSAVIKEVDQAIDCIYCGVVRALEQPVHSDQDSGLSSTGEFQGSR
jgi:hypothetical protein